MMGYKLVIAEKPSVAVSLSAVIGATARKDGYLEGNGWRVSWCVGHQSEQCGRLYHLWNQPCQRLQDFGGFLKPAGCPYL